ncbi:hypothetical protein MRGR3_0513 [Staphylococcus aureus subsp. aureus MRGR3]|nr:hypothetical protein MRGR3_0513 [Staphylococcus aureus subsp. aureus MRGR3]
MSAEKEVPYPSSTKSFFVTVIIITPFPIIG